MKRSIVPLKGWQVFSKTFDKGLKLRSKYILMSVVFSSLKNTDQKIYFGVGISKKVAKKAVVRTRVRRLLRESLFNLEAEGRLAGIDKIIIFCLVAPKYRMGLKMADVKDEISYLLGKANSRVLKTK